MQYKTIFDIGTKPFAWQPIWAALGALAFGLFLLLLNRAKITKLSRNWGYFMIGCAVLIAGYDSSCWYASRWSHLRNLASGPHDVVEGTVEDFHPMPNDGSSNESFTISSHTFSYSDYAPMKVNTCFNQTKPNDGPVRAGMRLHVTFIGNCILRLEALQPDSDGHAKQP